MSYTFALVGNPNCGKTTIFNDITGSTQYVGNWPGVTVEKKEGRARKFKENIHIVDLPGIYSLSPYSLEEVIARDYILNEKPDVIINIVDASNIERNLYLTTQLMELGVPVVVALNMMDVIKDRGDQIDLNALQKGLGLAVVPTSARKGSGLHELVEKALEVAQTAATGTATLEIATKPSCSTKIYDDPIKQAISQVEQLIASHTKADCDTTWIALKMLEGDEKVREKWQLPEQVQNQISNIQNELVQQYGFDIETILADNRYRYITGLIERSVKKATPSGSLTISDKIDKIVTNRILAIPLFLLVMLGVFQITFGAVGSATIDWTDNLVNGILAEAVTGWLEAGGASEWLLDLVVNGIIAGMGSILVFVPQIMLLFLFMSILEDSGYMARAAFVMDRLMRKLGLTGKSFIPMIMGFGCSVPAVMATRTLENEKDRRLTIILTPFMSCGARLPVYLLFVAAFFAKNQTLIIFSLYLLGILVAIVSGVLLKKTLFKGEAAPFVMELPPYRIPTLKGLAIHMWDRGKGFIKKAGTIIFAASVLIWFCQTYSFTFQAVEQTEQSIFGVIGSFIAPIFVPLGFGDWKSSVALLTGFVAKEAVVATMGILHGLGEVGEDSVELATALQTAFTPLKAYAFMAFTLLYMPCLAAFGAIKREMNSWKWTLFAVGYQTCIAWIVAFLIYQIGSLFIA